MKAGYKEKIRYVLKYIVCTFLEAVLLLFKLIKEGLKERR
jgi:hypothetical protein